MIIKMFSKKSLKRSTAFLLTAFLLTATILTSLCGCASKTDKKIGGSFFAMDTLMTVTIYLGEHTEDEANSALDAVKNEILRIEALFSVTDEQSEISALNRGEVLTSPSHELTELLTLTKHLYEQTDGAYDVTVYPLVISWGFTTESGNKVPSDNEISEALSKIDGSKVTVTENDDGSITVNSNGTMLDLGSVAKGYAAEKAAELLLERGFDHAILSLGGNVQVIGDKPNGSPFVIGIADPKEPNSVLLTLSCDTLTDLITTKNDTLAIVTSGTYQRNFYENDILYHHILDTKTGYPCDNGLASVTVITEKGSYADALSTALFLLGEEAAMQYYREQTDFEAIFVFEDGTVTATDGISELVNHALKR